MHFERARDFCSRIIEYFQPNRRRKVRPKCSVRNVIFEIYQTGNTNIFVNYSIDVVLVLALVFVYILEEIGVKSHKFLLSGVKFV